MAAKIVNPATPPIVDRETWLQQRETLLEREKAHTREGRRRTLRRTRPVS